MGIMGGRGLDRKGSPIILILFSMVVIVLTTVSSGALQTFHEPFESAAGVAANGGSLSGGSFVTGVFGNALHLPSSGSLSYPNSGKASIGGGTVVFLFRPQSLSNCGMLGIGTLSTPNSLGIFLATHPTWGSRHLVTEIRDSTMAYYQAWSHEVQPDTNTWMCIAATWDCDSGFRTYVNGVGGYTRGINICDKFTMSSQIDIGRTGWYADCNGIYDEMKFFDYELSSSEIMDVCTNFAACSSSSDCGTDGPVGNPYCSGGDSYQEYRTWTCHNPGQPGAYCSYTDSPQLNEDCGEDSCGAWGGNYCKGGDVWHSRTCHDRGCSGGSCFENPYTEEVLVEACPKGCENGNCIGLQEQIGWLASRQDAYPTGLVDSYEGDNYTDISCPADCPVAFTYDQATSIIAFTHAGEYERAQSILDQMEASQNPDGSWWGGLSAQNGGGMLEWRKSSGEAGWMVVAINYYEKETADTGYRDMKNRALGWLETMIDRNPGHDSYGGVCVGNNWWDIPGSMQCYGSDWWQEDEQRAFSTEHNFVSYGAFMGAANLTGNLTEGERLEALAWGMLDYVFREAWSGSFFYRGFRDYEVWLDPHTMAVLALGDGGLNGEDLTLGLDHCKSNMGSQLDFEAGVTVDGFSYNDYSVPIWVEGTGQMALAYHSVGLDGNWSHYISEIGKTVYPSGGVPYSFSDYSLGLPWGWPENQRFPSVAGTNWYYFSSQGLNPFLGFAKPEKPNITCTQDSDCGTDGWVGSTFCSGDDVYQTYRTRICHSPGTMDSFCSYEDTPEMYEDCGEDSCGSWGNDYCKGGDVWHSRTCHDRGCSGGSCFDSPYTEEVPVEACPKGCSNGACITVTTTVYVSPSETMVPLGASFSVHVMVSTPEDVYAGQFELMFNPGIVKVTGIEEGDFLNQDGADTFAIMDIDNITGRVSFASTRFGTPEGVSGPGSLAVIGMVPVGQGSSNLGLDNVMLSDNQTPPNQIPVEVANGSVEVRLLIGDVNRDCIVNILDLAAVGLAYGSRPGDANWNENADVTEDGLINIFDLAAVGLNYGRSC